MKSNLIIIVFIFSITLVFAGDDAFLKKANDYWKEGKSEMAELYYKKSIKNDPENAQAYLQLGKIYYLKSNYEEALKKLKIAHDLDNKSINILFALAEVYRALKDSENALNFFNLIKKIDKKYSYAYLNTGNVYYSMLRDKENTILNWEEFLVLYPDYEQAEDIRRALALLKDPNYVIPSEQSTNNTAVIVSDSSSTNKKIKLKIKGKDLKAPSDIKKGKKRRKGLIIE